MAEIKSAIELAMERTKNLVMGDDEKKEFVRKDREDRLRAVMRRFLEGIIDGEECLREYKHIDGEKAQKSALFLDLIIEEFRISTENEMLFALLEIIGEDAGGGLAREAQTLKSWFQKELAAREEGIRKGIVSRLKDLGISGTAVVPNIPEWEESQSAAKEIGSLIRSSLSGWRDKLLATSF
jgi:hypothetical protein